MVAGKQNGEGGARRRARELQATTVGKGRPRPRDPDTAALDVVEVGSPRDGTQGKHDAHTVKEGDLSVEEARARGDFAGEWRVVGRNASDGRNDVNVVKRQAVALSHARGAIGEACAVQCGE
jgi:hypothetical protein